MLWAGSTCETVPTDVSSADDVKRLFDTAMDRCGRVDVVVHSAGVLGQVMNVGSTSVDEWWKTFVSP